MGNIPLETLPHPKNLQITWFNNGCPFFTSSLIYKTFLTTSCYAGSVQNSKENTKNALQNSLLSLNFSKHASLLLRTVFKINKSWLKY